MRRWWPFGGKKRRSAAKDKVVEETKEANVVTNKNAKDITRVNQYKIEKKLGAGAFEPKRFPEVGCEAGGSPGGEGHPGVWALWSPA